MMEFNIVLMGIIMFIVLPLILTVIGIFTIGTNINTKEK